MLSFHGHNSYGCRQFSDRRIIVSKKYPFRHCKHPKEDCSQYFLRDVSLITEKPKKCPKNDLKEVLVMSVLEEDFVQLSLYLLKMVEKFSSSVCCGVLIAD